MSPGEEVTRIDVVLNVPRPGLSCHPRETSMVRLSALGDFPTTDSTVLIFDPSDLLAFDALPRTSRVLTFDAEARIGGAPHTLAGSLLVGESALGPPSRTLDALLLPIGLSCRLGDARLARLREGSVVALPDGGFLSIGGLASPDDRPVSTVARLRAGRATPDVLSPDDALFDRRAWATATLSGDAIVVAGGARSDARDALYDRIEIYDLATERFDPERALRLATARRDHGAGLLPDGRVLIVGGSGDRGETTGLPVEDAELIDVRAGLVEAEVAALPHPRRHPWVGTLDDGTVMVAGGDRWQGLWRPGDTSILIYSPADNVFVELAGVEFERVASATVVPLPGARLAYVGVDRAETAPEREPAPLRVQVLFTDRDSPRVGNLALVSPPNVVSVRAISLGDGRLLVTGLDEDLAGALREIAFIVDTSLGTIVSVPPPSRAPTALLALADGSIAELDDAGTSLRRVSAGTEFDNPGALLPMTGEPAPLALDGPSSWRIDRGALVATSDNARVDVARLRFGALHLELDAHGEADIVFTTASGISATVRLDSTTVGLALCAAPRATPTSPVQITRRGAQLTFEAGAASVTCAAPLDGRIAVALRARRDTTLAALRLTRLAD